MSTIAVAAATEGAAPRADKHALEHARIVSLLGGNVPHEDWGDELRALHASVLSTLATLLHPATQPQECVAQLSAKRRSGKTRALAALAAAWLCWPQEHAFPGDAVARGNSAVGQLLLVFAGEEAAYEAAGWLTAELGRCRFEKLGVTMHNGGVHGHCATFARKDGSCASVTLTAPRSGWMHTGAAAYGGTRCIVVEHAELLAAPQRERLLADYAGRPCLMLTCDAERDA